MKRFRVTALAAMMLLPGAALASATQATLYKSPSCGCCAAYAEYLETNGFDVEVVNRQDMAAVKAEAGVPVEQQSCHTTMIGRYTVEGHIPVDALDKLLDEKPFTRGITMPGMPMGSPGMGGTKQGPFEVYYIGSVESPRLFHSQ